MVNKHGRRRKKCKTLTYHSCKFLLYWGIRCQLQSCPLFPTPQHAEINNCVGAMHLTTCQLYQKETSNSPGRIRMNFDGIHRPSRSLHLDTARYS